MEKNKKLVLAGLFLALGIVLPFFTGQIKEIGESLLPIHLAIMLCGLVCGWKYGAAVGMILPVLRSLLFGMPHYIQILYGWLLSLQRMAL